MAAGCLKNQVLGGAKIQTDHQLGVAKAKELVWMSREDRADSRPCGYSMDGVRGSLCSEFN